MSFNVKFWGTTLGHRLGKIQWTVLYLATVLFCLLAFILKYIFIQAYLNHDNYVFGKINCHSCMQKRRNKRRKRDGVCEEDFENDWIRCIDIIYHNHIFNFVYYMSGNFRNRSTEKVKFQRAKFVAFLLMAFTHTFRFAWRKQAFSVQSLPDFSQRFCFIRKWRMTSSPH